MAPPTCDQLLLPHWLERRLTEAWTQQQEALLKEELQRKYRRVKFTGTSPPTHTCLLLLLCRRGNSSLSVSPPETTVDLLHDFANCSGLQLIFGLNALLRTPANVWNGSNARTLLQYAESRGYRMHWELGNGTEAKHTHTHTHTALTSLVRRVKVNTESENNFLMFYEQIVSLLIRF